LKTNTNVGIDLSSEELKQNFDAIGLTGGSTEPRDLTISGRNLKGIHFAMDFLPQSNKRNAGQANTIRTASQSLQKAKKSLLLVAAIPALTVSVLLFAKVLH
jgi:NADPH-dependent glutamate synthase beta subunit-like oxidoreductase